MPATITEEMRYELEMVAEEKKLSYAAVVDLWELCEPTPEGLIVVKEILGCKC